MKKFLFILAAALFTAGAQAQEADKMVKFEKEVHDFGKIKQGVPVHCDFAFTNISKAPVTVASATASCGCTTPVKPEQPVLPGKKDKIQAGYNAANAGFFEKTIFVTFDGVSSPKELKIKGEVVAADAYVEPATAPATNEIVAAAPVAATPVKHVAKVSKTKSKVKKTTAKS